MANIHNWYWIIYIYIGWNWLILGYEPNWYLGIYMYLPWLVVWFMETFNVFYSPAAQHPSTSPARALESEPSHTNEIQCCSCNPHPAMPWWFLMANPHNVFTIRKHEVFCSRICVLKNLACPKNLRHVLFLLLYIIHYLRGGVRGRFKCIKLLPQ